MFFFLKIWFNYAVLSHDLNHTDMFSIKKTTVKRRVGRMYRKNFLPKVSIFTAHICLKKLILRNNNLMKYKRV